MSKLDRMINQALSEEDQVLLASHAEPGYLKQAAGLFRGSMSWVMWLVYVSAVVTFVLCTVALWKMWVSTDVLSAVKWGVVGLAMFQFAVICKNFMAAHLEANRMLREIKRVELKVSLLGAE